MTRIWQDFRGGTDGQPVTLDTMDPGGITATEIVIDGAPGTGTDIMYSLAAGQRLGYPMGVQIRWSGLPTYMRWNEPEPDTAARYVARFPVVFDSAPTVDVMGVQIINSAGTIMGDVGLDTSTRIYFNTSTDVMPVEDRFPASFGTIYWVQLAVTAGTSATDGVIEGHIEDNQGTALFDWSNPAVNTGTTPIQHYRIGMPGTSDGAVPDVVFPTSGLVMGDLSTGWWPRLSPTNINIRPIPARQVGPGEAATIVAELWNQETGATWAWSQPSGPDLTLIASDTTATVQGPHRWNADSAVPDATPIGISPAVVEVTATLGSDTAPPVQVPIEVLPQLTWTRAPSGAWMGGRVAPWCEESPG